MEINRALISHWVVIFNWCILFYVIFVQSTYFIFLFLSGGALLRYRRKAETRDLPFYRSSESIPPVSIIIPAYNEEITIAQSLQSFLHMDYPEYEVLVVNDGSKDNTLQVLIDTFRLMPTGQVIRKQIETKSIRAVYHSLDFPNLVVMDKENGGKADAINAGINASRTPLFCVVDADSLLDSAALENIISPFVENPDEVVAVGGVVRVVNGSTVENGTVTQVALPKNHWARMQVLEYLRAFLIGRMAWSQLNSLLIIAGAFGVFQKRAVIEVGGYLTGTVGEDAELTMRLHHYRLREGRKWRVQFVPDPVCWTQAPEDYRTLRNQRNRWHRGLAESLWRHRSMFLNPRYGVVGIFAMSYFVFVEWLGPLIEMIGWIMVPLAWIFGILNAWFAIAFFSASLVYGMIVSGSAIFLEELNFRRYAGARDLWVLFGTALLESFYFRPLNSWWKTKATFQVRGSRHRWGEMQRKSLTNS